MGGWENIIEPCCTETELRILKKLLLSQKRNLFPLKHTYATRAINILMH